MINQVYNQCCLEGMKTIPPKSIDMILCDLPYGTTACKWDVIIPFAPLWEQYERVIKDNGAIVLTASQPFTSALVMSNAPLFKYQWYWKKSTPAGFLNAKRQPLRVVEDVLVFYKSQPAYNPQFRQIEKKNIRTGLYNSNTKKAQVYNKTDEKFIKNSSRIIPFDMGYPLNVIEAYSASTVNGRLHPTQKPVALFEYLIKTYTNEGETVLDTCMGSGTTAIACINTGRNYIGFEKEEKYFKIIQERIKNHKPQLKLAI